MKMLKDCLDVSEEQRKAVEEFDRRNGERKAKIAERVERHSDFGNRKTRRRQVALDRQNKVSV